MELNLIYAQHDKTNFSALALPASSQDLQPSSFHLELVETTFSKSS